MCEQIRINVAVMILWIRELGVSGKYYTVIHHSKLFTDRCVREDFVTVFLFEAEFDIGKKCVCMCVRLTHRSETSEKSKGS